MNEKEIKKDKKKKPETIEEELEENFTKRKMKNNAIIESYKRIGYDKKATTLTLCSTQVSYIRETGKLYQVNFCKDRLCNVCAWRRSMKIFGQVSKVMDVIEKDYDFIFLTLTVRSCGADELPATIDILQRGFEYMYRSAAAKGFKGYFKSLEVTHNKDQVKQFEYHPHIHTVIAVNKSYFHSRDYVSQEKLRLTWRDKCKLDYLPMVRIQKIKPEPDKHKDEKSMKRAVSEVTKYTIKTEDITKGATYNQIDRTVRTLADTLHGRRLCAFGGVFKEVAKQLKLDDMTDGDLVNTDNEEIRRDLAQTIITYKWRIGIGYEYAGEYTLEPKETKDNENKTTEE